METLYHNFYTVYHSLTMFQKYKFLQFQLEILDIFDDTKIKYFPFVVR